MIFEQLMCNSILGSKNQDIKSIFNSEISFMPLRLL